MDEDPRIDTIMFHFPMDFMLPVWEESPWFQDKFLEYITGARPQKTSMIIILPYTVADAKRAEVELALTERGFAVFSTVLSAACAINHLLENSSRRPGTNPAPNPQPETTSTPI